MAVSDEKEFFMENEVISASEDEEGSDDERKHNKLLQAISSLGGKRKKNQTERSEASLQVSEFSISAEGAGDKVDLSDLLGSVEKTTGASKTTKKQLRNLQSKNETLELPLNKEQTEKIQRGIAYGKSIKEVSRWQGIIEQNKKAEQLVFPLNQEPSGPKRVEEVVAGWKAQTPLEQEIFRLLHNNKQPVLDPVLTPVEEASLKAMSLEESKIRRAELQKARALQSYYEAKSKREKRIKSKKYHRALKRAKHKEILKNFDEMMKTDPEKAIEELKKMEMHRMVERMTLKHQNSGKWAKSKAIMAKYDESARKAMQEQLQINKDLTQKIMPVSDDDNEHGTQEEPEAVPDFVNDVEPIVDPVNPWMRSRIQKEDPEVSCVTTDQPQTVEEEMEEEEEERNEEERNEEEELLAAFQRKRMMRQADEDDVIPGPAEEQIATCEVSKEEVVDQDVVEIATSDKNDDGENDDENDDDDDDEEEEEEEEDVSKFNTLFRRMNSEKTREGPALTQEDQEDGEELLDEGEFRVKNMEDLEVLGETVDAQPGPAGVTSMPQPTASEPPTKKRKEIDLNEVLTKETRTIKVALTPTVVEDEEHEEQISIIKEAFAGDDVISDFLKDKRKQEEAGRAKVVDLTLPGWGEWGGVGLKPSRHKRKRFRVKVDPPPLRQDRKLPDVIISEKRNASIATHQVSQLPFPFKNTTQFESCIRTPIGQMWNTQRTVKKMITPKVVTKMGAIIEPLVKEDFIKDKSSKPTSKGPAILLENKTKAKDDQRRSSKKQQGRDSQKRRKNKK